MMRMRRLGGVLLFLACSSGGGRQGDNPQLGPGADTSGGIGDSNPVPTEDDAHTTGGVDPTQSSTSSGGTTGVPVSESSSGEDPVAGESSSSTGVEGVTAAVAGTLYAGFVGGETVAGAHVSVWDNPLMSTVTAADGTFELEVAADTDVILVAEEVGYYGAVRTLLVEAGGRDAFDLRVFEESEVDSLMPVVFPSWTAGAAVLVVEANTAGVTVDGSTPVGALVTPFGHFAWDSGGALIESNVTAWPMKFAVTVFNLGSHDPGDLVLSPTHATLTCSPPFGTSPPLIPGYITHVDLHCG